MWGKKTKWVNLHGRSEQWFDYLTISGKRYSGILSGGVKTTGNIKWTSDFWLETRTGWKICKSKKPPLRILESAKAKHMRFLKAAKARALRRRVKAMRLRSARILAAKRKARKKLAARRKARKKKWAKARKLARIRAAKRAAARKRALEAARKARARRRAWQAARILDAGIFIGKSKKNTKCVNRIEVMVKCHSFVGNKGRRYGYDWLARHSPARFHIYVVGSSKICARRLDKSYGWPFRLGIKCFKRAVKTKKTIYLGKFRGRTKCVHVRKWKPGVYCRCGRAGKGADGMTWYPDKRFHIYTTTDKVCARRKDKKHGGPGARVECFEPR